MQERAETGAFGGAAMDDEFIRRLHGDFCGDLVPDTLAFAEGRLLSIHPFADFNGRLTRLWLWELLRRLSLPPIALVPTDEAAIAEYLNALRAGDVHDFRPLAAIWRERLSEAGSC